MTPTNPAVAAVDSLTDEDKLRDLHEQLTEAFATHWEAQESAFAVAAHDSQLSPERHQQMMVMFKAVAEDAFAAGTTAFAHYVKGELDIAIEEVKQAALEESNAG